MVGKNNAWQARQSGRNFILVITVAFALVCAMPAQRSDAALNEVVAGVGDLVSGVFALPMTVLKGTLSGPPVIGTLNGAIAGTFYTLGLAARGTVRIIRGGIPIAVKLLPFLALF